MLKIQLDENQARDLLMEKFEEVIKQIEVDLLFWDSNELKRQTCMSWNTIQKEFFYDKDFPKTKLGGKWYFPARETKQFLLKWLKKQRLKAN